jgi:hypothetical protein
MKRSFIPPRPQAVGLSPHQILFEFALLIIPILIFASVSNFGNETAYFWGMWGLILRLLGPLGALVSFILFSRHLNGKYSGIQRTTLIEYLMIGGFIFRLVAISVVYVNVKVWGGR